MTNPVSLDDLKFMIDGYSRYRHDPDAHWHRAEAWSMAFEWRESWRQRSHEITPQSIQWSAHCDEGDEGMRLIREILK